MRADLFERRLLSLAALFLGLYTLALVFSPVLQPGARGTQVNWQFALPYVSWAALILLAHQALTRRLPNRDPYLLPAAGLLAGWGLLAIWRLFPAFGLRQLAWLAFSILTLALGLRLPPDLNFLRRYKYLWLTGGLALTGLTLLFGSNPSGSAYPRLWLGCCGFYFQPSEPLKLLLVVYLASYLADRSPYLSSIALPLGAGRRAGVASSLLPLLAPTILMTGLAMVLLLAQRDLGAASILLFLYTAIVYLGSNRKRIVAAGALATMAAGLAGYQLFDVVRVRVDAWLNPWLDPSGRSYQIVQSLIAIANGGIFGRGPGLGSPRLVPVPHSDFIFTAIAEETGLAGALGLLLLIALLTVRGMRTSLRAPDAFRRYLAAGLTAYLAAQSILIIGGNIRLMPLTGVTLPFVSYGGSSLFTVFVALLLLLMISHQPDSQPARLVDERPYLYLCAALLAGLIAAALLTGWWAGYRSPSLLARTDNPRRAINDLSVPRGALLARDGSPIQQTVGQAGSLHRVSEYPRLSNVIGYTNPLYGQAGLENSLDPYLRGLEGYPEEVLWWHYFVSGGPPPGLSVRLSLNLDLQRLVDEQLGSRIGAVVLLEAATGEILAMASHPTFDANRLEQDWDQLVVDPQAVLLNRATQGLYPPGAALGPWILARGSGKISFPPIPNDLSYPMEGVVLSCAQAPAQSTWIATVAAGCPRPVLTLAGLLGWEDTIGLFHDLGFYTAPSARLPAAIPSAAPQSQGEAGLAGLGQDGAAEGGALRLSPLQMALAAATLSNQGVRPAPRLALAYKNSSGNWTEFPSESQAFRVFPAEQAGEVAREMVVSGQQIWQSLAVAPNGPNRWVTWYLGGSRPGWPGSPLALAVLLEENDPEAVVQIGQAILQAALNP